ncbi:hypothetical protein [Parabacteroides sp. Marseille-P3160]|uniref:Ppx/GppA phosphatase family protein n=1 Tax=Parabacteroides sp. Marseille-P3160 TaxID=1917887 RepID=UPI0009B9C2FD|nr:hypothetical protein [Parabacteroides sp. Marseille-P3160]
MDTKRLAAIDIGSNSVKLLITDVISYGGKLFFKKDQLVRIPLKLGEDTFTNGFISEEKKEKLALLVQALCSLIKVYDIEDWRICATSALREATNRIEVIDYIRKQTGAPVEVLDPKEEFRYILLNNVEHNLEPDRAYIFTDVGGGSTDQIIFFQNKEIASESFKLGTIRTLSEEDEAAEWDKLKGWLNMHCKEFPKVSLIGSGGNINKLDSLLRRCGRIRREELIAYARKLRGMTPEERVLKLNMNRNRADVILPAINIYLRIMKMVHALVVETPIIGIADGIIKDLYLKKSAIQ